MSTKSYIHFSYKIPSMYMYLLFQELIPEFFCLPEMFTNMNGYKVLQHVYVAITFVDEIQKFPVTQFTSLAICQAVNMVARWL